MSAAGCCMGRTLRARSAPCPEPVDIVYHLPDGVSALGSEFPLCAGHRFEFELFWTAQGAALAPTCQAGRKIVRTSPGGELSGWDTPCTAGGTETLHLDHGDGTATELVFCPRHIAELGAATSPPGGQL